MFGFDVSDGGDQRRAAAFEELQASGAPTGTAGSNPASVIGSHNPTFFPLRPHSLADCYATLR